MSVMDTLFSVFKNANPDASDEDIRAHLESMKASPEQMKGAVAPLSPPDEAPVSIPDMDMSPKFVDLNSSPSSFDVNVSDNTVTQNGSPESVSNSPADVPAPPVAPAPEPSPAQPPAAPPLEPKAPAKPSAPRDQSTELKAVLAPTSKSDAEAAMMERERGKQKLGLIPTAAAGIGDAISSAASAFGAKGITGTQDKVIENIDNNVAKDKAAFELKQRKDPTSGVSQHYQKVLGLMLGDHAKTMDLSKMSAENIASTLPQVEKYMQKELGMQQIKSNKELMNAQHEQGRQDKLERETREWVDNLSKARNGELGVQNGKVDQARHLLQAFKQAEETGKPMSNATYGEVALGLANLMSSSGHASDDTRKSIMQATAKGDFNRALTFLGFDPSTLGGSTESVFKNLKDSVIRQGLEAEGQRNKFLEDQKAIAPSGLNKEQSDRILNREYGNSVKEFAGPKSSTPPKASAPEGTVKKLGSRSFTVINGAWHEIGQ